MSASDDRASPRFTSNPGLLAAIRIDLNRLYAAWMGLLYPRQRRDAHSVLGKWTPETTFGMVKYRAWGAFGVVLITIIYPLTVLGFAVRFHVRRIDRSAASVGVLGVVLLSVLLWGGLTVLARIRFSFEGFVAVAAAGLVAIVSAILARLFTRGGRVVSVALGYPFAMTAIFLPPVVAGLYSPTLADVVFSGSTVLAKWLLDNVLYIGGLNTLIRGYFDLKGLAYVAMWFAIAFPVGWLLGILVALADLVRPSEQTANSEEGSTAD